MPNIVNEALLRDLEQAFQEMGSCVVVEHGAVGPKQDIDIRTQLRDAGVHYRLVRTRIAQRALQGVSPGLGDALQGRCGFAIAKEEGAIKAAKILREWIKKTKDAPIAIKAGVVEGTVYAGKDAAMIADLPDRDTVRTQLATAVSGPARSLACVVSAVAGGLARCIQARIDKESA
ncbi:MAG: 50S ribosomal protein L10 [Planctomycetes bacterium]|nr:50S ribosomal protein L10 [Planctomycetota bacterium]